MVAIAAIRAQNAKFAAQKHANKVCVFVGATNGIGESTLKALLTLLSSPTIYVVGRSASRWEVQHQQLRQLNSQAKFNFVQAEVATIRGVDEACKQITASASKVDYLCMSAGYFPIVGQIKTPEGLEQCFTLSYWSRIRFLHNLLPALQQSPRPRILSILAAGHDTILREDDMGLEHNWTIPNFAKQSSTMKTLTFHRFAAQNPAFTLIHTWPGFVLTDVERKPKPGAETNFLWRWTFPVLRSLGRMVMSLRAIPLEESGQRHAFLLTSEEFGPGVWRFNEYCEPSPRSEALEKYVKEGKQDAVWDFTVATWEKALGSGKS
ncbi:hypothetical protein M409DRAFT_37825 [Zasmidium cellare ATCC 36951]|uniref:Ketoreductase (KR) domain-containing protein n=1 Tax=Zasmidium cellare ATCC 36951 TaxID=1080233 RepID=A0A6A6BYR0_ZASCE|nr:uncharacterized protein M409DRAFT_37825 [Zasmidium cellare ATCC 36951]KAF2159934.1 hypothetical protein M409DRAFT_37825 [Zasmidium cellare ATCC 36951]